MSPHMSLPRSTPSIDISWWYKHHLSNQACWSLANWRTRAAVRALPPITNALSLAKWPGPPWGGRGDTWLRRMLHEHTDVPHQAS